MNNVIKEFYPTNLEILYETIIMNNCFKLFDQNFNIRYVENYIQEKYDEFMMKHERYKNVVVIKEIINGYKCLFGMSYQNKLNLKIYSNISPNSNLNPNLNSNLNSNLNPNLNSNLNSNLIRL